MKKRIVFALMFLSSASAHAYQKTICRNKEETKLSLQERLHAACDALVSLDLVMESRGCDLIKQEPSIVDQLREDGRLEEIFSSDDGICPGY